MIAVASDHAGYEHKQSVLKHLIERGYNAKDCGTYSTESCDYPDFALTLCKEVAAGRAEFGILICGTGIGMSMAANKVKGIRCALVSNTFGAEMTRKHNDANVLALGARITPIKDALEFIDIFLSTPFEGGRHQKRVDKLNALDDCE